MKKNKIVVQINSECGRGSTGKIAVSISKLLSQEGFENYIFYSGNHKSNYPLGIQINSKLNLRIHQFLARLCGDQGWHSYFATKKLIRKLKQIHPDVIHLHNIHGYYLNMPILFDYLSTYQGEVVWTLHDCWPMTGHCTHFTISGCNKWKTGCYNCPNKEKYPYSWFFDRSSTLYQKKKRYFTAIKKLTIVTPSVWLENIVKESFLKDYPVKVIRNGIDLTVFKPVQSDFRKKNLCESKFIILGIASVWSYAKGLDIFCQLAEKLAEKYQIVLVGTTAEVDKILPPNIISIHRTQNQEELAMLYSTADVFLNPTREDTYPTVNLEALACGTPVLTFNTGGSPECVKNKAEWVIQSNDIGEIITKLDALSRKPKGAIRISENRSEYDENLCYRRYIKLYESLLEN